MKLSIAALLAPALLASLLMNNRHEKTSRSFHTPVDQRHLKTDTLRPDPVCNMKVDDKKGDTLHYKGHIFGFCSAHCKASFQKNPDSYLPKKKAQ